MWGQWRGSITGTNIGQLVLNIDEDKPGIGRIQVADNVAPFIASVRFEEASTPMAGTLIDFGNRFETGTLLPKLLSAIFPLAMLCRRRLDALQVLVRNLRSRSSSGIVDRHA